MQVDQLMYRLLMAQGSLAFVEKQLNVLQADLTRLSKCDTIRSSDEDGRRFQLLTEYDDVRANEK